MRAVRLAIAALIAMALAVLPMSAGLANPSAAKAEMSTSPPNEGCPCCDTAPDSAVDLCNLNCCAAILAGEQPLTGARWRAGTDMVAAALSPFSLPPDPPPPRS